MGVTKMMLVLFVLSLMSSCRERPTRVTLRGDNNPTFELTGSGQMDRFYISEADAEEQPVSTPQVLWAIVPIDSGPSGLEGVPVEKIGKITYGLVPPGYRQVIPHDGKAPELVSGRYYDFHVSTVNAPHAWGYFVIRNGQAEFARIHGYCIGNKNGKEFKMPCGETEY
jgi:hypothetical protein